jgi:hypothetical protein
MLNMYHAKKGEGLPQHTHEYHHAILCTSGSLCIRKEGKEMIIDKNTQPIVLVADEWHEVEALKTNTSFIEMFAEGKY